VAAAVAVAVLLVAGASVGTYLFRKHRAATALEVARRAPAAGIDVGRVAREIEGEDIDGHRFRLSDYRGKVVLLDFWGNW
jgi:cytochrome oxidase Cu insertion factor (SCO1/SenC/PrrC family)